MPIAFMEISMRHHVLLTIGGFLLSGLLVPAAAVDLAPVPTPSFSAEERALARSERNAHMRELVASGQIKGLKDQYASYQNYPAPLKGTHESRVEERRQAREQLSVPETRLEIIAANNEWARNLNTPRLPRGTRESRTEDRHLHAQEVRALVGSGQLPVSNEEDVERLSR